MSNQPSRSITCTPFISRIGFAECDTRISWLAVPFCLANASAFMLILQAVLRSSYIQLGCPWTSKGHDESELPESAADPVVDGKSHESITIYAYRIATLIGCLCLLALSLVTFVLGGKNERSNGQWMQLCTSVCF